MAYIEREKVKEEIQTNCYIIGKPQYLSKEDTLYVIDKLPAADVVEVRHGHWGKLKDGYWCSNCCLVEKDLKQEYNYCPHCGAKMDGKDGE